MATCLCNAVTQFPCPVHSREKVICWCERTKAAGGSTCEPCQIRALTSDLNESRRLHGTCEAREAALHYGLETLRDYFKRETTSLGGPVVDSPLAETFRQLMAAENQRLIAFIDKVLAAAEREGKVG